MKPKLLLLHGALGTKKQFDPIKNILNEHFEVFTMDFEGHGDFESNSAFSIALFSENVVDFLVKKQITNINIFGYSMGGYVALAAALKIPERIGKIATLGTKFDWTPESAEKEVRMLNPDKIDAKVPHFAQKLKADHHPQDWKAIMHKTADMMMDLGNGAALNKEDLTRINIPVHIGIGTEDNMVSLEESEWASQLLPHGRLMQLEGTKHPIDQVDATVLLEYVRCELR